MTEHPHDHEDELEIGQELSIEFTLLSGETITVRALLEDPATEESVQRFAATLIQDLGADVVRTFTYWWEGELYVDAVRMREVAAISVSSMSPEDDEADDWEE
jgi:hypothetical protein